MARFSLLCIATLAIAGCSNLKPSWFPGSQPSEPAASPVQSTPQPTAGDGRKAPPEPAKPEDRATADYLRELTRGVGLEQSRQYGEARELYEHLIKQCPARYEAYHRLGQLCDRQKRCSEAQDNYQQAILLSQGRDPDLFNDLGYSFFLQGKLDKADSAIRKAVALRAAEPKYHNNLGLVYGNQRRFDEAWNEFRLAGGEANAFYNLAFVKASLNDFQGAKDCFRRALTIDPSHDGARRALRVFEMAENDPDMLAQLESTADDGTQWVPYVEGGQGQDAAAAAAAGKDSGDRPTGGGAASSPTMMPGRAARDGRGG